jgi:S-adenosylmethionine decarboxylase
MEQANNKGAIAKIMKLLRFILVICACGFFSYGHAENEALPPYQFKGEHFLASYCECDHEALTNLKKLEQAMLASAEKSGATVLNSCSWEFPENGFTMVILLSESHASIHTYPEHNACFVDLFTCGEKCSSEYFDQALRDYLKPKSVNGRTLIRKADIQEKQCSLKTDKMLANS